jgi:3-oxoacyl-[acyl-carrier-protein] synthase-3
MQLVYSSGTVPQGRIVLLMSGVFVAGTGKYIPSQVVSNSDLAKIVDTSDEWITDRTGIKERRFSSGEPTWYMGKLAAQDAIKNAKIDPQNIDLIIACTITPDYFTPSLACIIQSEIGAENAFCFDLNAACSGFIYALDAAQRYLVTDGAKTVLIVCSEILSKITDFSDRSTCVLFGDGAASVVLIKDDSRVFSSEIKSEGRSGFALLSRSIRNESPYARSCP